MGDTTTWRCVRSRSGIQCIRLEIRSALGRRLVSAVQRSPSIPLAITQLTCHSADVYIVADGEGNEMVLKLHRSVLACGADHG